MHPKHIAPIIKHARAKSCMPGFDRPNVAVDAALRRVAEGIADDVKRHDREFSKERFMRDCGFPEVFKAPEIPVAAEAATEVCAHGGARA